MQSFFQGLDTVNHLSMRGEKLLFRELPYFTDFSTERIR